MPISLVLRPRCDEVFRAAVEPLTERGSRSLPCEAGVQPLALGKELFRCRLFASKFPVFS